MAYRDFSKKHPVLAEWVIPTTAGVSAFGALTMLIPWGFAALAGISVCAVITHRTY
jgi:hypothetical protein